MACRLHLASSCDTGRLNHSMCPRRTLTLYLLPAAALRPGRYDRRDDPGRRHLHRLHLLCAGSPQLGNRGALRHRIQRPAAGRALRRHRDIDARTAGRARPSARAHARQGLLPTLTPHRADALALHRGAGRAPSRFFRTAFDRRRLLREFPDPDQTLLLRLL